MPLPNAQQGGIKRGPVRRLGYRFPYAIQPGHINQPFCFTWNIRLMGRVGLKGQALGAIRLAKHIFG